MLRGSHAIGLIQHSRVDGQAEAEQIRVDAAQQVLPLDHIEMEPGDVSLPARSSGSALAVADSRAHPGSVLPLQLAAQVRSEPLRVAAVEPHLLLCKHKTRAAAWSSLPDT